MIAKIKHDNLISTLTPEDKQLIDEIGESLWTGGYGPGRMKTKYWKDIVE